MKELCDNYDSNYYGAVGVLKVIKVAQKYKIELLDRLTFCNSMNKKVSYSEDEAKNKKDQVEKSITKPNIKPVEIKTELMAKLNQIIEPESPLFSEQQINELLEKKYLNVMKQT
ncbi:MAG: hypothetical protein LBH99_03425 [Rickettsia sp.]|jgi:hypothetical protein|nr:hypothetical protein [Rickettsia sp.]